MKFLIDADFLVALAKEDDTNHISAVARVREMGEVSLFVTPFAIPEAATVLSYKLSHGAAKKFLEEARQRNFFELPFDQGVAKNADIIFLFQQRKGTSWIDCYNAARIKEHMLDGILSFDKGYKRLGIRIA